MELSGGSSPQGKMKASAFRAAGKQSRSADDTMSNKGPTRRPPQPPMHVRALQQHKSQPDSLLRTKEQPEAPRRSKSTPVSSSHLLPSKHHSPLSSSSSSFNPPSRHLESQNGAQRHSQPSPTAKRPLVTTATQQPTQQLDSIKQKLVDRAIKARLYLLHQSGPNRFLVGGDAPDSRFHVTIGPQSCSCNKAHCVHLLFVMLRVLKVGQNDPMLWQRQLRNYEAESLLRELQARVTLRTTPRKSSKKRFDFSVGRSPDEGSRTSPMLLRKQEHKEEAKERETMEEREAPDRLPLPELGVSDKSPAEAESDKSDMEETEDVCPICLNELDEGEDLLVCSGCHNHLHHHCMDVWAGEEKRKSDEVHCPVCRAIWPYTTPITSPSTGPSVMPVSVPIGTCGYRSGEGGMVGGMRLKSVSPAHPSQILSAEKSHLVKRLKSIFGPGAIEELFSTDWKARETALSHLSREAITLLLPQLTSKTQVGLGGGEEGSEGVRGVQDVCMQVVAYSCNDSVLKVFLAALELMRVILGYSVCYSEDSSLQLQTMLKPVLPVLLTRCADAQRRVKECSIDTMCNLCLGQEGPLSVGSACGQQSPFGVSDIRFVLESALSGHNDKAHTSWHWWLGRLNFLDRLIARFTLEFLLEHCILVPPSPNGRFSDSDLTSGFNTPMDSITSLVSTPGPASMEPRPDSVEDGMEPGPQEQNMELNVLDLTLKEEESSNAVNSLVENNLLFQVWYFAAKATHITHNKLGKVARRVIIRVARVLKDQPSSLEIVHDVVERCHRTQAEGLLDRVLRAREKPHESSKQKQENGDGKKAEDVDVTPTEPRRRILTVEDPIFLQNVESSLRISTARHLSPPPSAEETAKQEQKAKENEFVASDDSFRSAASDFDFETARDRGRKESGELLEASSSTSNSHDSRTDDGPSSKSSSSNGLSNVASGGSETWKGRLQPQYSRQTTADSLFSTDAEGSIDSGYIAHYQCKRRIEEEEAETEAKIRSLLPADNPHPPLTGVMPPSAEVLIHMQSTGKHSVEEETTDSSSVPYLEGVHWVKGKLIGTGAFCTCSLARDVKNGTMFAVKQVSFVRNTDTQQEEELKRLREEIAMLGRMNHPNIVRCLGATQHETHINIFIEWMAGGCLDQLLHDFGAFSESVVCRYVRQVIHGIVFLHENGIIHRDLKGGNILVDSTGQRVRIADFGAAARLASHTTDPGEFQDMEGTVAFMAPEVVRGGSFDDAGQSLSVGYGRKCDVWSIGCVIIQMATAKPPWVGAYDVSNKYQLIFKIGNATSPPPYPDFLDPALKDLTIRCLEIKPEDRPTSSELLKHPIFTQS